MSDYDPKPDIPRCDRCGRFISKIYYKIILSTVMNSLFPTIKCVECKQKETYDQS